MASEPESPGLPDHIVRRILRLDVRDPLKYTRDRIPALDHRTLAEVLAEPDGEERVAAYLGRVEEYVGRREPDEQADEGR
jgi:rhodanese-related sulfurtransferase